MPEFSPEIIETEYIGRAKPEMEMNQFSGNTSIGYTNGGMVYVKDESSFLEPNLAAGLTLQSLPVKSPRVDFQNNQVVFKNLEGFDALENYESTDDLDPQNYLGALASKALVGDMDISYNILVKDGEFGTCDYDFAGISIDLISSLSIENYELSHEEILNYPFEEDELKAKTGELAREIDTGELEEVLRSFDLLRESSYTDRMLENVKEAQKWH